ncbi:MAG: SEC-C domain-containing protein [Chloroflexi bacterium]|nr:SEC-C domain-containing protein [Chloroflexota bacterium]
MSEKQKLGRNDPCWCGSGKKYKHCHRRQDQAEAKRSAVKPAPATPAAVEPAPMTPTMPEPPPVPPEIAAINARWDQFEAADLEGKVTFFLETLASGEMDREEAYEMLQNIRDNTDPRRDPQARARYAELVERLRQEAPDLYRYDVAYYNENLINDAIAGGRWEAIPELLAGFAEGSVDRGIDIFFQVIEQLKYHGQTEPLIQVISQMWSGVSDSVDSGKLVPWTSEELGSEVTLLTFFQYVETAETPRAKDPALLEAASPYGSFNAGWLKQAVPHLSAPAPSPWQRADFGEAVDAEQWEENLSVLLFEFMADQRRRAGAPFSKSDLARDQLLELLHQQFTQPEDTSSKRRTGKRRSKAKKRARQQPAARPLSSLAPRYASLDRHLVGQFGFLSAQPYKAAALTEMLPAYLHFLARLDLIHPTEMDDALGSLRPLAGHLRTALDNYGANIAAVQAVEAAWSEPALAALRDDPALVEARATPLPEAAPPLPQPVARSGAVLTYTFKVTYQRKRSVWQLIEIAADQTLDDLHYAILSAVDFDSDHLYSFYMSGRAWDDSTEYASPYADGPSADEVKIGDLSLRMKQKFLYLFDYGDEHRFDVQLVGVNPEAAKGQYPRIVESHGKPPQQYGGW